MGDADNLVIFGKKMGWLYSVRAKRWTRLPRVGNSFVMDMKVPATSEEEKGSASETPVASAFRRPE